MVDDLGSSFFTTESLAVGTHLLSQVKVSILPGSNSDGHEELLRMNFLKQFRYRVDFGRSIIEWGGYYQDVQRRR